MGKEDPNKPRGKMSSYTFFVQMCWEKHKKKHPDSPVNFAEFSKKSSERWKTMSAKEKSKFEDLVKSDKARYDREKNYIPPKNKQPYEQKAAKLKEKYEKDIAAYRAKGKTEAGKKGPGRPTVSKKKNEPEDEEEEEKEEDEDDEEEEEDEG
ncbi:high mobility group protein B2 [Sigmodon hispidus]